MSLSFRSILVAFAALVLAVVVFGHWLSVRNAASEQRSAAITLVKDAMRRQSLEVYCGTAPDIIDDLHDHDGLDYGAAAQRTNVAIGTSLAAFMDLATTATAAFSTRHNDPAC